ncbi:hypothetical protein V6N13_001988 [Hibiscus sabdariffa]
MSAEFQGNGRRVSDVDLTASCYRAGKSAALFTVRYSCKFSADWNYCRAGPSGLVPWALSLSPFFSVRLFILTLSFSTLKMISSLSKSITALLVDKKGLPRMIGAYSLASQSRIKKSAGKMNLSTFTSISSIFPSGWTYE